MRAVANGDRTAFERLYRRYHKPLTAFAAKVTKRTDTSDDVVNEAMLVVWRSAARFEGRSQTRTWIFGITYRQALNAMRSRRRSRADDAIDLDNPMALELALPSGVEAIVSRDSVARALAVLPAEQRAVVELTYFLGHSMAEVAEIVGSPVGTVKTRMFAAKQKMLAVLSEGDRNA